MFNGAHDEVTFKKNTENPKTPKQNPVELANSFFKKTDKRNKALLLAEIITQSPSSAN